MGQDRYAAPLWLCSFHIDLEAQGARGRVRTQMRKQHERLFLQAANVGDDIVDILAHHGLHRFHLPLVIVASHLADDQLWAEALNLGAHDVLAKPF